MMMAAAEPIEERRHLSVSEISIDLLNKVGDTGDHIELKSCLDCMTTSLDRKQRTDAQRSTLQLPVASKN